MIHRWRTSFPWPSSLARSSNIIVVSLGSFRWSVSGDIVAWVHRSEGGGMPDALIGSTKAVAPRRDSVTSLMRSSASSHPSVGKVTMAMLQPVAQTGRRRGDSAEHDVATTAGECCGNTAGHCGAADCCGGGAGPVKVIAADVEKDGSSLMDAQSLSSAVTSSRSSFDRVRRSRTWPIPENPDEGDVPDEDDLSISDGASLAQQPALHRHRTLLSMQRRDSTQEDGGGGDVGGRKETRTRIKWTPSTGAIVYGDAGKAMPLSPAATAGSLPGASFS